LGKKVCIEKKRDIDSLLALVTRFGRYSTAAESVLVSRCQAAGNDSENWSLRLFFKKKSEKYPTAGDVTPIWWTQLCCQIEGLNSCLVASKIVTSHKSELYTGLFEMIVGVLTTCHKKYT